MTHYGILTDVTKCIGCNRCVDECKRVNETGEDRLWRWTERIDDLSATRWTTVVSLPGGKYVRHHCRHCLQPACVSACPVGALHKTPEGPVAYNKSICLGCRYCMMSCPFGIPRYQWSARRPYVRKCFMCYDQIRAGTRKAPGCTEACPTGATIFGERADLLAEARRRIAAEPQKYKPRIWGETEVGGTSVIYVSDVDLDVLPSNRGVGSEPLPDKVWGKLRKVPYVIVGVGVMSGAVHWIIERRIRLQSEAEDKTEVGKEDAQSEDRKSQ